MDTEAKVLDLLKRQGRIDAWLRSIEEQLKQEGEISKVQQAIHEKLRQNEELSAMPTAERHKRFRELMMKYKQTSEWSNVYDDILTAATTLLDKQLQASIQEELVAALASIETPIADEAQKGPEPAD